MVVRDRLHDLIRLGTYAQLEGSVNYRVNKVQFSYFLNQIIDMKQLAERVVGEKVKDHGHYIRIYKMGLYEELQSLGFRRFGQHDWNVPNINSFGESGKKEYLRAVIDSIGNVDVTDNQPYIKLSSVNHDSLIHLSKIFGAKFTGPYNYGYSDNYNARWKSSHATSVLEYLDYMFYNHRNRRGAELIKSVRWETYI